MARHGHERESGLHQEDLLRLHTLEAILRLVLLLDHGGTDVAKVLLVFFLHVLAHLVDHALGLVQDLLRLRGVWIRRLHVFDLGNLLL